MEQSLFDTRVLVCRLTPTLRLSRIGRFVFVLSVLKRKTRWSIVLAGCTLSLFCSLSRLSLPGPFSALSLSLSRCVTFSIRNTGNRGALSTLSVLSAEARRLRHRFEPVTTAPTRTHTRCTRKRRSSGTKRRGKKGDCEKKSTTGTTRGTGALARTPRRSRMCKGKESIGESCAESEWKRVFRPIQLTLERTGYVEFRFIFYYFFLPLFLFLSLSPLSDHYSNPHQRTRHPLDCGTWKTNVAREIKSNRLE